MAGNDKFVGIRLPTELEALARQAAGEDNRTLAGYIRDLVIRDVRSRSSTLEGGAASLTDPPGQYKAPKPSRKRAS